MRRLACRQASGGAEYCQNCYDEDTPCSRGERGSDGEFCVFHEFRPQTREGAALWNAAQNPAVYVRAGMDASIVGLDLVGLKQRLPPGLDEEVIRLLSIDLERGTLQGVAEKAERARDDGT